MSRRASLPGAEELFRKTGSERGRPSPAEAAPGPAEASAKTVRKAPKHDEKVTFYCTREDLMALEQTRLRLRAEFGRGADRGRIVRAALSYVLEDFEARGEDSVLLHRLGE